MKKTILSIFTLLAISTGVTAQNVNIPDVNFKSALLANTIINSNGDTEIQVSEANAYTGSIVLSSPFSIVSDLTGLEEFTQLSELDMYGGGLSTMDVSQNINLEILRVYGYGNQPLISLSSLDLTNNILLTSLTVQVTSITVLDLSSNTSLELLNLMQDSLLTSVDISNCSVLSEAYITDGQLSVLDLSGNPALVKLNCKNNLLIALDFSSNSVLTQMNCSGNQLSSLDITNGNNTALLPALFDATNNPSLTCITVSDVVWCVANLSNTQFITPIDTWANYSFDCNQCYVNIPDPNFKTYLLGNTSINLNGDNEIECAEASQANAISCIGQNISDLTGVEAFTGLITLRFGQNQITSVDLSSNVNLTWIECDNNQLGALDLAANINLEALDFSNNQLDSIDLTNNGALWSVQFYDNQLVYVNIANGNNTLITNSFYGTNNPNLYCIQVDDVAYSTTNWTSVDAQVSFNIDCSGIGGPCTIIIPDANFKSYLIGESAININGDSEIQCAEAIAFNGTIDCGYLNISDLTGIEEFTSLTTLNCYGNLFTSINLSSNSALTHLNCDDNSLATLDVTQNLNLTHLICSNNTITNIDLSGNTSLMELDCNWNSLTVLDVANSSTLTHLICNNNSLSTLDVSSNSSIVHLNCVNNSLTELNIANGNNVNFTTFFAYNNPNLTCVKVDDEVYSTTNWSGGEVDPQTSFSTSCSWAGISDFETESMSIYPNPVRDELFFELAGPQITELVILDYAGRIVKSITNNSVNSIDVSDLKQGVYILKISTENGVSVNRFVKQD